MVGDYSLFYEGGEPGGEDLVVVDSQTGDEVARLPSPSWPVEDARGGSGPGHDGVAGASEPRLAGRA